MTSTSHSSSLQERKAKFDGKAVAAFPANKLTNPAGSQVPIIARSRRVNIVGAVTAPVGHILRGAWHIAGSALRALFS